MISDNLVAVAFSCDEIPISGSNQFISKHIGKIKNIKYTLAQSAACIDSKSAMELIRRKRIFPDQVRKAPVTKGIQSVIVFQKIFHNITGFETGIADQVAV